MKWIVFGDLHINKPFKDMIVNPYSNLRSTVEDLYAIGLKNYILDIVRTYTIDKAQVVFIGDITHYNQDRFEHVTDIFDSVIELRPNWQMHVVIGNHDTSNSYNLNIAKIRKLHGYRDRVYIYDKVDYLDSNDFRLLFLPYVREATILPTIKRYHSDKPMVILSHNNIYSTRWYGNKEMITYSSMRDIGDIVLINGHIHRHFIMPGYYQIGSAAPTSFKEYFQARGCCVFDDVTQQFTVHKNTKLFFLSLYSEYYIDNMRDLLQSCETHNTKVFLRTQFKQLAEEFKDTVVALEVDSENQQ